MVLGSLRATATIGVGLPIGFGGCSGGVTSRCSTITLKDFFSNIGSFVLLHFMCSPLFKVAYPCFVGGLMSP